MKRILLSLTLTVLLVGCSDFERVTFQTLTASQAVVDQAQKDYESRTIPRTECAYAVINDGKAAQVTAVQAMAVYEKQKDAKQDLTAQTAVVVASVATIPALVVQIKALYTNPTSCGGAK